MKRVLSTLLLVLVLVPLLLLGRWGGEARAPWSVPSNGVQARLVAPRYVWRSDEDVQVRVRLRNRTGARVPLPPDLELKLVIHGPGVAPSGTTIRLAAEPLDARAQADFAVPPSRLVPGVAVIDGEVLGMPLPPLKLRVVTPKR